jgi:hypothetical protein
MLVLALEFSRGAAARVDSRHVDALAWSDGHGAGGHR